MAESKSNTLKILVDSDVIFDFISARLPHYHEARKLFILTEKGLINSYTLPHLLINVWQAKSHMKITGKAMYKSLRQLMTIVNILDEPANAVIDAMMVENTDLEDWVTVECAKAHEIDLIISRNTRHFKKSPIAVITPGEFVAKFSV